MQSTTFSFKDLTIFNSEAIIHIFNNLSRFLNFWKISHDDYLFTKSSKVPILEYKDINMQYKNNKILHLKKMAFYIDFIINLVLFRLLKANGIFWDMINNILFQKSNFMIICTLNEIANQQILKKDSLLSILITQQIQKRKLNSWMSKLAFKDNAALWHTHMRHPGPMSLYKLGKNCLGVDL